MTFHYQSLPAYLAAALSLAVLGGFVLAVSAHVYSVVVGLVRRPNDITPQKYQEEFRQNGPHGNDPGWPTYTHQQLGADLRFVNTCSWSAYQSLWRRAHRRYNSEVGVTKRGWWFLFFPLPAMTFLVLLAAWPFMVAQTLIFLLAFSLVLVIAAPIYWALVLVARTFDGLWRAARGGQTSCPQCYAVMPYSAFQHSGCSAVHHDVRSASEGILHRRCRCGKLLSITVVRAAWRLDASCQRCGAFMPRGSSALRDLRVSVFGDVNAGKTRFTFAALDNLDAWAKSRGLAFLYADKPSAEAADSARTTIRNSGKPARTSDALPRAVSCQVGGVLAGALMHIFDTAGERFHDASTHDDLHYLGDAHGLVFIVDPFSLESVRRDLRQRGLTRLLEEHPAQGEPEELYGAVVSRIRAAGTRQRGQRLAVVVTKADILAYAGMSIPSSHPELASWLHERGQHNMVVAAEREFSRVHYFAASSSAPNKNSDRFDPSAPLRWLLNSRRYTSELKIRGAVS